jgi:hypothetical protein
MAELSTERYNSHEGVFKGFVVNFSNIIALKINIKHNALIKICGRYTENILIASTYKRPGNNCPENL